MLFETLHLIAGHPPGTPAWNMAVDEALAKEPQTPVLRVYAWDRPAVSFGYFEKIAEVRRLRPRARLVRRWTGGGVVDHGSDWTYSLIVPAQHPFAKISVADSYQQIHTAIAAFLQKQGHAATLASAKSAAGGGCFQSPVMADIVLGHDKIAGAAQRRTRRALLHQGSIQNIDIADWSASGFASHFAEKIEPRPLSAVEIIAADFLAQTRYACEDWLTRL